MSSYIAPHSTLRFIFKYLDILIFHNYFCHLKNTFCQAYKKVIVFT